MGYSSQVQALIYGEPAKIDGMVMAWRLKMARFFGTDLPAVKIVP